MIAHKPRDASHAIAALPNLLPIGIIDPNRKIGIGRVGTGDEQQLIETDAPVSIAKALYLLGIEGNGLSHAIDDHDVVPQSVHLCK